MKCFGVNSSSDIPAPPGVALGPRGDGKLRGDSRYRKAWGSLMWRSTTWRPDISNAVLAVARHSHKPSDEHWKAVMTIIIMACLHGTRGLGLTFAQDSGLAFIVYSDAEYAD